jgi:hypothetical protein
MYQVIKYIFVLTFLSGIFISCSNNEDENKMLMSISGNPGEVIFVTTTNQWNGLIGETIQSHFLKPVYGMPQDEPLFNVIRTNKSDFNRIFETFRNVVIIEIDTNRYSSGEVTYHKNAWANDQLLVRVIASSRDELIEIFNANADQIIHTIQSKEFNRLYAKYKAKSNAKIQTKLREELQIESIFPREAVLATVDNKHAWIRIEREKLKGGYQHQISQGVLIFKYPYLKKQQFLDSNLFAIRDSILQAYIPGPSDGSYLTTEYRYSPPITKEMNYQGHFAKEIHGLWRMENNFMGGPMATYFVLNEDEGMIYCISGYAFAPQFEKREYYREIEAIARSVQFANSSKP